MATKNEEAEHDGASERTPDAGAGAEAKGGAGPATGDATRGEPKGSGKAATPVKDSAGQAGPGTTATKDGKEKRTKNNVRKIRMERMMSKAELARRAGVSTLTIDRVENGLPCRMDTKRKILEALGLNPSDRVMVFGEDD